jgi:two-component system, NarL family, sensor histidine kinase EvgS
MNTNHEISPKKFAGASSQPPIPPSHRPHILLADGDSYTRALNARVLTQCGYTVQAVANGADAWKALDDQNYDLLITENEMPEVTGVQLMNHLRSKGIPMPVIMASGTLPAKELKLHPGLRLEAALLKPVPGDALLQTVWHLLQATENSLCGCQPVSIKSQQVLRTKAPTGALQ